MLIDEAKQAVRNHVWGRLEEAHVVEDGVAGHIPDFEGSAAAAALLTGLPAWRRAQVIKVVPDRAQEPVRANALREGKLLYMAVPMLAREQPYYRVDPTDLAFPPQQAAVRETAAEVGRPVDLADMRPVDLVVVGSVAVNHDGVRLGKGAGYSDIELALLTDAGLLNSRTVIATTVHDLQILDENLPEAPHDFRVDLIVTPNAVIACDVTHRPGGVLWDILPTEKRQAIPILRHRLPD